MGRYSNYPSHIEICHCSESQTGTKIVLVLGNGCFGVYCGDSRVCCLNLLRIVVPYNLRIDVAFSPILVKLPTGKPVISGSGGSNRHVSSHNVAYVHHRRITEVVMKATVAEHKHRVHESRHTKSERGLPH